VNDSGVLLFDIISEQVSSSHMPTCSSLLPTPPIITKSTASAFACDKWPRITEQSAK
jgi:hypothetical protein